jgi:hypothetical protein
VGVTPVPDERVRELVRHHKERAVYFEQASDGGKLAETLASAAPHWELYDALKELLALRDLTRIRVTKDELPKGDVSVLAWDALACEWVTATADEVVTWIDVFTHWRPLDPAPKEGT